MRLPFHLALLLLFTASACTKPADERPNVIVILVDDMGYSDIGPYGGEIDTPNLDRLAEEGLRFRRFYNAARCCPTRASLLTGLYPHQAGMGRMVSSLGSDPTPGPYQGYLSDQSVTLAELLGGVGYRTYMSGKWHVGEKPEHWPRQRGFDRYFGLISGASSYYEIIKDQPRIRQMALDDARWEPPAEGFYMTDAFSEYAVQFLRDHQAHHAQNPFFLYLAYTAPHWPLHALPEDIAKYRDRYTIGWDSLRAERYRRMRMMDVIDERYALSPRPASIPAWEDAANQDDWALRMAVYAAMIDRVDQGIAAVLAALEAMDAAENTLLFFLSDNGGCAEHIEGRRLHNPDAPIGAQGSYVAYQEPWGNASNTPFRLYKQWVHEGGIATPLIVHWPNGIAQPGRITDQVGHVIDLMATISEVTGATYPDTTRVVPLQGKSLAALFAQPTQAEEPRTLFWEHIGNRAVRQGNWKLSYNRRAEAWELYNLEADPTELHNRAADYPDRARHLQALWEDWADEVGVFASEQ